MAALAGGMTGPVIFTTREDIETPRGGSSIRIAGYTTYLEELGVNYSFLAPIRPVYVPVRRFEAIKRDKQLCRFIYAFLSTRRLRFVQRALQKIIDRHPLIENVLRITEKRLVWAHQTGLIPLYLAIAHGRRYIYDVHGILKIQKEYFDHVSIVKKARLVLNVWLEKKYFCHASYVNAASIQMKQFIADTFKIAPESIIVTPEGLLQNHFSLPAPDELSAIRARHGLRTTDRVIFFAGNFKKFGGVHLLADVFCRIAPTTDNLKLFLVGSGQMEKNVLDLIRRHNLQSRLIHLPRVDYHDLPALQQLSTIIVCPDLYNRYNEMVAHIKVFDSLAAQKPVLASRFPVLLEEFPESKGCILYFEPSNPSDLERAIRQALEHPETIRPLKEDELKFLTYRQRVKGVMNEYRRRHIIHE